MPELNWRGQAIDGIPKMRDVKFIKEKIAVGYFKVDWNTYAHYSDGDGFDVRCVDALGKWRIRYTLPKGTHLIRYGREIGFFTAPYGTTFEQISLPYDQDTCEYHEYIVAGNGLSVICEVDRGIAAPNFGMPGGGVQFLHDRSIKEEKQCGNLETVEWWKK